MSMENKVEFLCVKPGLLYNKLSLPLSAQLSRVHRRTGFPQFTVTVSPKRRTARVTGVTQNVTPAVHMYVNVGLM